MSDKCGDCDCSSKSQCTKKGYTIDVIEIENSYTATMVVMDMSAAAENGCKCGASCACTNCTCGH